MDEIIEQVPELNAYRNLTDSEVFFQDINAALGLVKNNLLIYTAYELKEADVKKYMEDPKADVPSLKKEAELRGVTIKDLAASITEKAEKFRAVVRGAELLRIEFNQLFPKAKTHEDKMALRDRLLGEFNALINDIPS